MKKSLQQIALLGLAGSLLGCASNGVVRSCDLEHPYQSAKESEAVKAPAGLLAPPTTRTYKVPSEDRVAPQPAHYLTPASLETATVAKPEECLLHPPVYQPPVDVTGQDLSDIKPVIDPRVIPGRGKSDDQPLDARDASPSRKTGPGR